MKPKANPGASVPQKRDDVGPGRPPKEHQFKPGNPGGSAPKGKRISTWMVELLNKPESEWPKGKNIAPGAKIAMARIKRAQTKAFGESSTNILLDRTEGPLKQVVTYVPLEMSLEDKKKVAQHVIENLTPPDAG